MKASGYRRGGEVPPHPPPAPSGLELVGAVVRALDITRDAPDAAKCILVSKTTRRAFRGEGMTKRWCCPLTALLESVLARGLADAPEFLGPTRDARRLALFVPIGIDLLCWDSIVASGKATNLRAHFRYALVTAANRIGMTAAIGRQPLPTFLKNPDVWLDPERRNEPLLAFLREHRMTQQHLAAQILVDPDTVSAWLNGARPQATTLQVLGALGKRVGVPALEYKLRWHYALCELADGLAARLGRPSVLEAFEIACAVASCVAGNRPLEQEYSAGKSRQRLLTLALAGMHSCAPLDGVAEHVRRHGASIEFVADLLEAHDMWRATLLLDLKGSRSAELDYLLARLPGHG